MFFSSMKLCLFHIFIKFILRIQNTILFVLTSDFHSGSDPCPGYYFRRTVYHSHFQSTMQCTFLNNFSFLKLAAGAARFWLFWISKLNIPLLTFWNSVLKGGVYLAQIPLISNFKSRRIFYWPMKILFIESKVVNLSNAVFGMSLRLLEVE